MGTAGRHYSPVATIRTHCDNTGISIAIGIGPVFQRLRFPIHPGVLANHVADEIAAAAVFLASGALASGQTVFVDSGQYLLDQPRDVIWLARAAAAGGAANGL